MIICFHWLTLRPCLVFEFTRFRGAPGSPQLCGIRLKGAVCTAERAGFEPENSSFQTWADVLYRSTSAASPTFQNDLITYCETKSVTLSGACSVVRTTDLQLRRTRTECLSVMAHSGSGGWWKPNLGKKEKLGSVLWCVSTHCTPLGGFTTRLHYFWEKVALLEILS